MSIFKRQWAVAALIAFGGAVLFAASPASARECGKNHEQRAEAVAAAFTDADVDGSGTLDAAEFAEFRTILKEIKAEAHFNRLDANADGVLSLEEIEEGRGMGRRGKPSHRGGF